MKRADELSGLVLLFVSLWLLYESSKMEMFFGTIPGSGFLPFWLSLALAALSAMLIYGGLRRPAAADSKISWPGRRGLLWIVATLVGLVAYTFLIGVIGYILSTFAFMWLLVWLLGSYRWYWSAAISLATAVGLYAVFQAWLAMELPTGLLIIP